ncbi:MAG: hypothetical protein ACPGC9_00605 [Cytophagales bacterium]
MVNKQRSHQTIRNRPLTRLFIIACTLLVSIQEASGSTLEKTTTDRSTFRYSETWDSNKIDETPKLISSLSSECWITNKKISERLKRNTSLKNEGGHTRIMLFLDGFSRETTLNKHFPQELKNLTLRYYMVAYDSFIDQKSKDEFKKKYEQILVPSHAILPEKKLDHINASLLSEINFFEVNLPKLDIVIEKSLGTQIDINHCRLSCVIIRFLNVGKINIRNTSLASFKLDESNLESSITLENVEVENFELNPRQNRGLTLKNRLLTCINVKVYKQFTLSFATNRNAYALLPYSYAIKAINFHFGPSCKVTMGSETKFFAIGSKIINSPIIQKHYNKNKHKCCYNCYFLCCGNYEIGMHMFSGQYNQGEEGCVCQQSGSCCCKNFDHYTNQNQDCFTLLSDGICCPLMFCCSALGCLGLSQCCKETIPFLCDC